VAYQILFHFLDQNKFKMKKQSFLIQNEETIV